VHNQILHAGTANYSHVEYFDTSDKYDLFYLQLLKVIDVHRFSELVQKLLLTYIRETLLVQNSIVSSGLVRTGYCQAHAEYAGSNNNIGVEPG
jgi:hypothetical protein